MHLLGNTFGEEETGEGMVTGGRGISPTPVPSRPSKLSVQQTYVARTRLLVSGGLLTTSTIPTSQRGKPRHRKANSAGLGGARTQTRGA